jgi:hypothetical protein
LLLGGIWEHGSAVLFKTFEFFFELIFLYIFKLF